MKRFVTAFAGAVITISMAGAAMAFSGGAGISADEALARLKEGNTRYVAGAAVAPRARSAYR